MEKFRDKATTFFADKKTRTIAGVGIAVTAIIAGIVTLTTRMKQKKK